MKKTIITILGTIDYTNQKSEPKTEEEKAQYTLGSRVTNNFKIEEKKYINMFDLIVSNYKDENIIALGTKKAIDTQKSVLKYLNIIDTNIQYIEIEDDKEYDQILKLINNQIAENENIIFDVSHGFRHLPILAIISLIVQNIQNSERVQEIIYAKEVKQFKEYEIISLKEYLDLANLSYLLNTFDTNYTVGNEFYFVNENYQNLVDKLKIISTHILANSLKQLLGEESHISKTIQILNDLMQNDSNIKTFQKSIESIIKHLQKIQNLDKEVKYIQLFKLSQMMKERGYVLNAITLLNEAIGFYCVEVLKNLDDKVKEHIEAFEKNDDNFYELVHQSKNIIKLQEEFKGSYLKHKINTKYAKVELPQLEQELLHITDKTEFEIKIKKEIANNQQDKKKQKENDTKRNSIKNHYVFQKYDEKYKKAGYKLIIQKINEKSSVRNLIITKLQKNNLLILINLIKEIETLRNNLAHANSSEKIENVQQQLVKSLKEFDKVVNNEYINF